MNTLLTRGYVANPPVVRGNALTGKIKSATLQAFLFVAFVRLVLMGWEVGLGNG